LIGWRRNWLPIGLFAAAAAALLLALAPAYGAARSAPGFAAAVAVIGDALRGPVPTVVLAPFRWVIAPLLGGPAEWPAAVGVALLVLLAHYAWVLRTGTAFEESAAAAGERRARAAQALRAGGGWRSYARALRPEARKRAAAPAAFRLAPSGPPEIALIWKNLTFARRNMSRNTPVVVVAGAVALTAMFQAGGATRAEALEQVASMALIFGAFMVFTGPLWVRNDLRMDLVRIDVLRTMPLHSGRLVAAEIAASAITASLMALALLGLGALLLTLSGNLPLSPGYFLLACLGGALVVPALITLGVTVQCAIALTFPAWVHLGRERPAGVEAMGQNILTLAASLLLMGLLLLPPLLLGLLAGASLASQWGPVAPALAGLVAIAASYGEVVLAASGADGRHPAFAKLFVESEYLPEMATLLFRQRAGAPVRPHRRRRRRPGFLIPRAGAALPALQRSNARRPPPRPITTARPGTGAAASPSAGGAHAPRRAAGYRRARSRPLPLTPAASPPGTRQWWLRQPSRHRKRARGAPLAWESPAPRALARSPVR
jgi:hypothetical protein